MNAKCIALRLSHGTRVELHVLRHDLIPERTCVREPAFRLQWIVIDTLEFLKNAEVDEDDRCASVA